MNSSSIPPRIRLLLADDHKIMREGLASLITNDFHWEVVGHAETGREAVALVEKLKPHIVLMDITMPDMNGIEATRHILDLVPGTKIIALSMHADKIFITEMMKAGASAYLLKQSAAEELERAVIAVMQGHTYITPAITGIIIQEFREAKQSHQQIEVPTLSSREREVVQLLAEGKSGKEIANHLSVSIKTVESHRNNIMSKLGLYSIAELTKYAIREGITSIDR